MDPENPPKSGKEFVDQYLEGDDVATIIGLSGIETPDGLVPFANVIIDYVDIKESMRESYAAAFERYWVDKDFDKGFDIVRRGPGTVRVSSKHETLMMAVDEDTNVLKAPSFFTDLSGDEEPIGLFFKRAEETGVWVLHVRTIKYSYVWVVKYPDGGISSSYRKEPFMPEQRKDTP